MTYQGRNMRAAFATRGAHWHFASWFI